MSNEIFHALVLNLHQPSGNLDHLLDHKEWEAKEILYALDRMPRSLWSFQDVARVHLSLSGTLLETLSNPGFQNRVYGIVKCGDLLWHLQNTQIFEILGTGYYHPVFPLIPEADWDNHLNQWLGIAKHLFFRDSFKGFWPPEMGFRMEMIPHIKRCGYKYVMVDSQNVVPVDPMQWQELHYRPHIARYGDDEIIVVVRDRELSNAQLSGVEIEWFQNELYERTKWCDFPPLVTTATDGENGGWFRNVSFGSNFWDVFYVKLLIFIRIGMSRIRPTFISNYLQKYGAQGEVKIRTGAWNTGDHDGIDFLQWTGSQAQKDALSRVQETSTALRQVQQQIVQLQLDNPEITHQLAEAQWRLLRAETSCHFYWGEAWVHKCHSDLDVAWENLNAINFALTLQKPSRVQAS